MIKEFNERKKNIVINIVNSLNTEIENIGLLQKETISHQCYDHACQLRDLQVIIILFRDKLRDEQLTSYTTNE